MLLEDRCLLVFAERMPELGRLVLHLGEDVVAEFSDDVVTAPD
jgi:hypothetical protein